MILGLAPLTLAVTACQSYAPPPAPYPAPYPGPPVDRGEYRAIGTEPFWDLTIGPRMTFADRGNNVSVAEATPPVQSGVAGEIYNGRRLRVNIVHSRCNDGMSDRTYPDTVQVGVDGRRYQGCGAPASFFLEVDERGNPKVVGPPPGPVTTLERTRWRITHVNRRPVPRGQEYFIDFDSGRIAARFGCNRIAGPYTQTGTTLNAGALVATRMACPNMRFETEGSAILEQLVTIRVVARNRLWLSSTAGTIDLVRR